MDIRIEKTEKAIRNAFFVLRSKKPLEKITVKELCQTACINKSTFYSHYSDIYALSEALEVETVRSILESLSKEQGYFIHNLKQFTTELCFAFLSHISLINILFSGKERHLFANRLEEELKKTVFQKYPAFETDSQMNILLSYCIQGAYHAYLNNQSVDADTLVQTIAKIVESLQPLYRFV